jgi:hypothetical protein
MHEVQDEPLFDGRGRSSGCAGRRALSWLIGMAAPEARPGPHPAPSSTSHRTAASPETPAPPPPDLVLSCVNVYQQRTPHPGRRAVKPRKWQVSATSCDKLRTPGEASAPGKTAASASSPAIPAAEQGMVRRRADRRGPDRLAQAHRPRRRPGQGRAENAALPDLPRRRPAGPRRPPPEAQDRRGAALGDRDRRGNASAPCRRHPDRQRPVPAAPKEPIGASGTPGHPARQPGRCHTQTIRSRSS